MGKYGFTFTLIILILASLSGCYSIEKLPHIAIISTEKLQEEDTKALDNSLKIGIASVISPEATRIGYDEFIVYLGKKLNTPISLIQGKTYEETNQLIASGEVDIAFICSLAYVLGTEGKFLEGIASPEVSNQALYRSYIIVKKDSGINSLAQLKGKVFGYTDPDSYSGRLAPMYLIKKRGENPTEFFKKTFYTYSHDYSVKAVANGLVDGAAVDSLVYDQMVELSLEDAKNLKIIDYGEWVGTPPVVISNYVSKELKEQAIEVFLTMHEDPEGKQVLNKLNIDRFVPTDDQTYIPIKDMLEDVGEIH